MQRIKSSIRRKTIIVFLISSMTLTGLYFVYKFAFRDIFITVGNLSYPNKKLSSVNNLFFEIIKSEKNFRNLFTAEFENKADTSRIHDFFTHSNSIKFRSDSLRILCSGNNKQIELIDSINNLIEIRNNKLMQYISYKEKLKNNSPVLRQINLLDSIISTEQEDILIVTNEHKKTTSRIDTLEFENHPQNKNILSSIFKRSKANNKTIEKTEQEDINTITDTIIFQKHAGKTSEIQKIMKTISQAQNQKLNKLLNMESELNEFEKSFNSKIIELLSEVEKDVIQQTATTQLKAETVINRSILFIDMIVVIFFLSTAIVVALIFADATKSKKYRLLLEKARDDAEYQNLAKQMFLSNMSHEIRTPLQSIVGYSEQINKSNHLKNSYIDVIKQSSEHLLHVVNEVLDYSRINSGKFSFEHLNFSISQTIVEVMTIVKLEADKKKITLVYNKQEIKENYIKGDPYRLKQILLNLIGNAIKFTEQGQITVKIENETVNEKEIYSFSITDTGIGIPHQMQERIFDQFEQVDLRVNGKYNGTGLGLCITKALIEGQGGSISLESEPGKGSCFKFNIPYEKVAKPISSKIENDIVFTDFKGEVWLIDDDKLILQLYSDILSKYKIKHKCYSTAISLLDNLAVTEPTMILIDIRMPDMNGIELCKELKIRCQNKVYFIAITAHSLPDEKREILKNGFDFLLAKPIKEKELMSLFNKDVINQNFTEYTKRYGKFDTRYLEQMLGGNRNELNNIIAQYISETKEDIQTLNHLIVQNKIGETGLILHRLSGRTSQIGARGTGSMLRKLEIQIKNNHQSVTGNTIIEAIRKIEKLIIEIENIQN